MSVSVRVLTSSGRTKFGTRNKAGPQNLLFDCSQLFFQVRLGLDVPALEESLALTSKLIHVVRFYLSLKETGPWSQVHKVKLFKLLVYNTVELISDPGC